MWRENDRAQSDRAHTMLDITPDTGAHDARAKWREAVVQNLRS
jgi:hypothetical protein